MSTKTNTNQIVHIEEKNWLQLLAWPFLFSCISIFLFNSFAHAGWSDTRTAWSNFTGTGGYTAPYTYLGQPIADHETSSDPTHGPAAVPPASTDLSSASPAAAPGPEDTPSYGYYNGTTDYDPLDPSTMEDDYLFFRMRLRGDPTSGTQAQKTDFSSYHWNILLDVDDDGYKEYWIDLEGSYASGNDQYDRLRILYSNDNNQSISDPDAAEVEFFTAYDNADASSLSHTLAAAVGDGSGDYWIDIQVPLTAFNDENGNQVVYPNSAVGFVFSTGASNQNPLQKDWMMDLNGPATTLVLTDPITFGDVVILNGEPKLEFVDSALEKVSFYTVGDTSATSDSIYTYVKYPAGNTTASNDYIDITVTNPRTGDDEQLRLYESTPTSGLFTNNGGAAKPAPDDPSTGWIPTVTTSAATAAATWTLTYQASSSTWLITEDSTSHTAVTAGTEYTSDNGEVTFTLYENGTPADGDQITFDTFDADPLISAKDYTTSPDDPDNNGDLEVLTGDTIKFSLTTPSAQTYTTETNIVGSGDAFIEFTRSNGLPSENFQLTSSSTTSDKLYVTVTHQDSNADDTTAETIDVVITSTDPSNTDKETITLTETGLDTGIFRNLTGLDTQISDGTYGQEDSLWEDSDGGVATATFSYEPDGTCPPETTCEDYDTTATLFYLEGAGRVFFTNSSGTQDVELYASGQSVYMKVEDKNNLLSSSVQVTVTSPTSGDSESIILYETSSGSGVFINSARSDLVTTALSSTVTSASSVFQTTDVGRTLTILDGPDAGDYIIATYVSSTQVTLTTPLPNSGTGISFTMELTTATYDGSSTANDGIIELTDNETLTVSYVDTVPANGSTDGDTNTTNDTKTDTATYNAPPIVINEVYFYPSTVANSGETEYFQVYNASGSAIDISGYSVTDGDGFTYTFPASPPESPDDSGSEFTLSPGEKAYIFLYTIDISNNNYYDVGTDTNYLFAVSGDASDPSDQFGDPDDTGDSNRADQLLLYDNFSVIQDYVSWSYYISPSVDFLGDDSPAVTQAIWQDDNFLDVLNNPAPITQGSAIARISDGFDTDVPSDWDYSVSGSAQFGPGSILLTPVGISSFKAYDDYGRVLLQWETAYENGTVGFYLYRKSKTQFMYELVNEQLIPALIGSPQGGKYRFYDEGARAGTKYSYLLEEVVETGERIEYGPFKVKARKRPKGQRFSGSFNREPHKPSFASAKRQKLRKLLPKNRSYRRRNPNKPDALKLTITEPGLYFLESSVIAERLKLKERRVERLIRKSRLHLRSQGQSIPYFSDGIKQGIYFYGFAHNDIYTDSNVFWLSLGTGQNMNTVDLSQADWSDPGHTFMDTVHVEEDSFPVLSQPWDSSDDYWVWGNIFSGYSGIDFLSFTFHLEDIVDTSENAIISLHLIGGSMDGAGTDHSTEVSLNGSYIGECEWQGIDLLSCDLDFPQSLLNDEENTLDIQGILLGDAGFSLFYVDSFDISYERHYRAVNNALKLHGDSHDTVSIAGFDNNHINLLDITDPYEPELAVSYAVSLGPSDGYQLKFSPGKPENTYLAVSESGLLSPDHIEEYKRSKLKQRNNWADYLIITPEELSEPAQELADYRARQGLAVQVITFEQIVNEFNYGIYSPLAIKKFLTHAMTKWRWAPEYAVLIGDANFDYKDVQGVGGNMLPTVFAPTPKGLSASDNYLADIDDDMVPDLAIGRLPVLNAEELQNIIAKIKDYESLAGSWKDEFLLLAGEPDTKVDFDSDSDRIARLVPNDYSKEKIYLSKYPLHIARQKLFGKLSEGVAFVNYIGHGGPDRFTHYGLLHSNDVDTLSTNGGAPIITAMTCAVGEFIFTNFDTMAELLLLQPNGGATAVWSASDLSENSKARHLNAEFYRAVYNDGYTVLGKAILRSFQNYSNVEEDTYHILIYNLLGDPALKIR